MVELQVVQASNERIKGSPPGLVAVFVGGTSGIAESTAKRLAHYAREPNIYLVGRNKEAASRIITELESLKADGKYTFIEKDISLLKSVDEVCEVIKSRESKVNLLFMTSGTMSLSGRDESSEGIDKKLATNYYSRMRFTQQLLPLLKAATPQLSRVVSVLSPGSETSSFNMADIGLRKTFSLPRALNHAVCMTDFMFEEFARQTPTVSFIHSYPGGVKTGYFKEANPLIRGAVSLLTPIISLAMNIIPIEESGERHLYVSTNGRYSASDGRWAFPPTAKEQAMKSSDGKAGGGAYLVGEKGEYKANESVLQELRRKGAREAVAEHTFMEFERATAVNGQA